jgi:hypothetical protein
LAAMPCRKDVCMYRDDDSPDRRFWTAYDHFMIEQEARAVRRAHVNAMLRNAWRYVAVALTRARSQPRKPQRPRPAVM